MLKLTLALHSIVVNFHFVIKIASAGDFTKITVARGFAKIIFAFEKYIT